MRNIVLFITHLLCLIMTAEAQDLNYQNRIESTIEKSPKIIQLNPTTKLYDYELTYFSRILVSTSQLGIGDTIIIRLGEKITNSKTIDRNPGGNIRYYVDTIIKTPQMPNIVYSPIKKSIKNTSGNAIKLPASVGILLPFRYVEIELVSGKINPSIEREYFYYHFNNNISRFTSSDSVLNAVWQLSKHTIKATSFAGLYIDGDRERIPYEADALINQLSHYAVDSVYDEARNTIEYLLQHPTWPTEWHLQMHQMVWNDYLYTGNKKLFEKYYDLLKQKTLSELAGECGLISTTAKEQPKQLLIDLHYNTFDKKEKLRDITDWPQGGNKIAGPLYSGEADSFVFCSYNSVVNAFYYKSLKIMESIAGILNKKEDVQYFKTVLEKVHKSYLETFYDVSRGVFKDGDTTSHSTLHSNFFALFAGLVKEEAKPNVLKYIKSKGMGCSVYGSQFLLDALYDASEADYGLSLLTSLGERSWYNMIKSGAGMTTEAWDYKFKPNLDWNHAWGAAPANIISRNIAGIKPIEAGCKKIIIHPQPGKLSFFNGEFPLPQGVIKIKYQQKNDVDIYLINIPQGINAQFVLDIQNNNETLSINNKFQKDKKTKNQWVIKNLEGNIKIERKK